MSGKAPPSSLFGDPELFAAITRAFPESARLDPRDLGELLALMGVARVPAGTALFHAGDPPGPAYLILSGQVRVERALEHGRVVLLGRLGDGDFVGDLGLLDRRNRSASARAETDLWALTLTLEDYQKLRAEGHPAALWLLSEIDHHMARRIRAMYERLARVRAEPALALEPPAPPHKPRRSWLARLLRLGA